ncbi:MAG TPA: M14 family zinc carboxypeptidase [Thermoleophilaceae bacterium]|jgi:protein MpaA
MQRNVLAVIALTAALCAATAIAAPKRIGHSEEGRPIVVERAGNPAGVRILVVGCIHGNECAGLPVVRALRRVTGGAADLWLVPTINPDGRAHNTRQDARGVDLNRNWSSSWRGGGRPFDTYYGGPKPFSERETRVARNLIKRIHPQVTIWFHQHMNLIWAYGNPGTRDGRIYARAVHMRLYHHPSLPGTSTLWQDRHLRGSAALTVELPAGSLSSRAVRRHERAVLALAARLAASTRASSAP